MAIVVAIVKSFRNRYYLLPLLPILLLILYASGWIIRAIHGGLALSRGGCDMGVCEKLDIMNDGQFYYGFYYQAYPESGNHVKRGTAVVSGNEILLYTSKRPYQSNKSRLLKDLKTKSNIQVEAADFKWAD